MNAFHNPARHVGETQEEYKVRRCASNLYAKDWRTKARYWPSSMLGTYRKQNAH